MTFPLCRFLVALPESRRLIKFIVHSSLPVRRVSLLSSVITTSMSSYTLIEQKYSQTCSISYLSKSSTCIIEPVWNIPNHFHYKLLLHMSANFMRETSAKPEDHLSCIAPLSAEDMLKSAVIEEKKFKHNPWAGADNPLWPKFWCQQEGLITVVICCKLKKNLFNL